ncbi:hypothetical protein AS032_31695 [Rhodococcus qingshengii]|nr:hypothetical protein AS032_31695 [Rhodococcus qingshengii]
MVASCCGPTIASTGQSIHDAMVVDVGLVQARSENVICEFRRWKDRRQGIQASRKEFLRTSANDATVEVRSSS